MRTEVKEKIDLFIKNYDILRENFMSTDSRLHLSIALIDAMENNISSFCSFDRFND